MSLRVAVAGKGGTGKTTLSAALVRVCLEAQAGPVLAVDADPNSNFSLCLGLAESTSLADIREEKDVPAGMSKLEYMNLRVQECLSEGRGVDLICMGRPEGPGCYCAVNHLLRNELSKLQHAYPVVIIDNEAGMEHLSRRTTDDVDVLLVVMGPDRASALAAGRILAMVPQLQIKVGRILLVAIRREPEQAGFENLSSPANRVGRAELIPEDPAIRNMAIQGQSIFEIPFDSAALTAVRKLWKTILQEATID
jgi:CO dehydrogenase maturation factor